MIVVSLTIEPTQVDPLVAFVWVHRDVHAYLPSECDWEDTERSWDGVESVGALAEEHPWTATEVV
jgi:hypothetical protein